MANMFNYECIRKWLKTQTERAKTKECTLFLTWVLFCNLRRVDKRSAQIESIKEERKQSCSLLLADLCAD